MSVYTFFISKLRKFILYNIKNFLYVNSKSLNSKELSSIIGDKLANFDT